MNPFFGAVSASRADPPHWNSHRRIENARQNIHGQVFNELVRCVQPLLAMLTAGGHYSLAALCN